MYSAAYRQARGHRTDTSTAKTQDSPSTRKAMDSLLPQGQQLERLLPPQGEHRSQGRRRPGTGGADHKILAPPRVLGPPDQKDAPRRHGQQNGKQHQHSAFSLLSFLMRSLQK